LKKKYEKVSFENEMTIYFIGQYKLLNAYKYRSIA